MTPRSIAQATPARVSGPAGTFELERGTSIQPETYRPATLDAVLEREGRLQVGRAVQVGADLARAIEFLDGNVTDELFNFIVTRLTRRAEPGAAPDVVRNRLETAPATAKRLQQGLARFLQPRRAGLHRPSHGGAAGQAAAEGRGIKLDGNSARGRDGITGERKRGDIGFASLRGGNVVGEHSVIFAGESETLTLSHSAIDRGLFARGAIAAAVWVRGKPPGLYDMQDVLGFSK